MTKLNAIDKLDSHHEAMILKVVFEGATTSELEAEFGLSNSYIGQLKASECWKLRVQELQKELTEQHLSRIHFLKGKAIDAYAAGVSEANSDLSLRVKTASEILNRSGLPSGVDINVKGSPTINVFRPAYLMNNVDAIDAEEVEVKELEEENE